MSNVGIVIVSHSPLVAQGAADMVRQMVGDDVPLAWCGGDPAGGLGTSLEAILGAIDRAWSDRGVAVLVDLGGARTNAEMAIEMLDADRSGRVTICDAPVVEGAVMAATESAGGASLATVRATAEGGQVRATGSTASVAAAAQVLVTNAIGLHARPSVKLTRLARGFGAEIDLALGPEGPWIDAKSIVKVMATRALKGTTLFLRARGDDAEAAVEALVDLVKRNFDENGHAQRH